MMDYNKIRDDAQRRRAEVIARHEQIAKERTALNDEDNELKRELIGLDHILEGLEVVSSDIPPSFEAAGFTDHIRKILTETPSPLLPTQIRDALQAHGITGSSPKNLLINVHKVLERIKPELDHFVTSERKSAYRHKSAPRVPQPQTPVVDLMAALKKSLADMEKKNANRAYELTRAGRAASLAEASKGETLKKK
jgi:hypothetical protein